MSLFDNIFTRATTENKPTADSNNADDVLLESLLKGDSLTADNAKSIPPVAQALNKISNMVAILPIKLYKYKGGGESLKVVELKNDKRVYLLNNENNDTLSPFNLKRNLAVDYLIDKGGFVYVDRNKDYEVVSLKYIMPDQITAVVNTTNPLNKTGYYLVAGKNLEKHQIISVLKDTTNGFLGNPAYKQVDKTLSTALTNIAYNLGIAVKGGSKKGFLISENKLSREALNSLKSAWRRLYSNTSDNVVVLNAGLKFQEASQSAREMQSNERNKTLNEEILSIFGVTDTDFDNVFRDAVTPVLEAIESALNQTLLLEEEKGKLFFEFDKREIKKAELKTRYEAYKIASETGWLVKNEIRKLENLEPIDGLDVVSMGLGDVLYDVKTQEYYTPNTGDTKKFNEQEKETNDNENNS